MARLPRWLAWFGVLGFSVLGPACIYLAYQKHGADWAGVSFRAIFADPIYLYAAADLLAVFAILSFWTYLECRRNRRRFWFWPLLYLVFGTPAFLVFHLTRKSSRGEHE